MQENKFCFYIAAEAWKAELWAEGNIFNKTKFVFDAICDKFNKINL